MVYWPLIIVAFKPLSANLLSLEGAKLISLAQ